MAKGIFEAKSRTVQMSGVIRTQLTHPPVWVQERGVLLEPSYGKHPPMSPHPKPERAWPGVDRWLCILNVAMCPCPSQTP